MALITCPECKKEVSDTATVCPSCGYKLKRNTHKHIYILIGLLVIIIAVLLIVLIGKGDKSGSNTSPNNDSVKTIESNVSAIDSLNEKEKVVYELLIDNTELFTDPRSIRVLDVPQYCNKPEANEDECFSADLVIAKLEGGNSVGGTVTEWFLFSLSDRGCAYKSDDIDNLVMLSRSMYPDEAKRIDKGVVRLCYKGQTGKVVEIEDYDALQKCLTLATDSSSIDESKINKALEEHWDK